MDHGKKRAWGKSLDECLVQILANMRCPINAAHEAGVELWILFLEIRTIRIVGFGDRPEFESWTCH